MPEVEEVTDKTPEAKDINEEPVSPSKGPVVPAKTDHTNDEEEDDDDEDIDETLVERLVGLTEMFPEPVRNAAGSLFVFSIGATKWLYRVGRVGLWVAASSATMLALPVMFEMERSQMEEQQIAQQRQILLGPNAAVSGGMAPGMMPAPPIQR